MKGREGMFQSAEEIEKIEPRLYKPPVSAQGNLRKRSKISETQPPKIVIRDTDCMKRI